MNGGSRQKNLMIVLGILLVIVAWRYLRPMLGFGGDAGDTAAQAPVARTVGEPGDEPAVPSRPIRESRTAHPGDYVAELRVPDLDRMPGEARVGRDPWRFVDPPPPPPPPPPPVHVPTAAELEALRRAQEEAAERARLAAIEAAKPRPPEFTMEYLGHFGPPEKKIAVFSNGKTTLNALEGQVIDNKFIVARIGYESVDIKFVNFPGTPAKRLGVRKR